MQKPQRARSRILGHPPRSGRYGRRGLSASRQVARVRLRPIPCAPLSQESYALSTASSAVISAPSVSALQSALLGASVPVDTCSPISAIFFSLLYMFETSDNAARHIAGVFTKFSETCIRPRAIKSGLRLSLCIFFVVCGKRPIAFHWKRPAAAVWIGIEGGRAAMRIQRTSPAAAHSRGRVRRSGRDVVRVQVSGQSPLLLPAQSPP